MQKIANYINGALVPPNKSNYLDNYEPATGQVYAQIPDSSTEDVEHAYAAAKAAFPAWSTLSTDERSKILYRIASLIEENLESLAAAESKDNGKFAFIKNYSLI